MATAPTPGTLRTEATADPAVGFIIGGRTYRLDLEQLSSTIEKELWDQAGLTVAKAVAMSSEGASFGIQGIIFLSRRCDGEQLTYADCEITFGQILTMSALEDDEPVADGDDIPLE